MSCTTPIRRSAVFLRSKTRKIKKTSKLAKANGYSESQAKREVSRLLGHEREDVPEIYLGALEKGGIAKPKSVNTKADILFQRQECGNFEL